VKAVILQSGYMPWLGFFDMIAKADVFVYLDDVQWTTRDWRNRNRIRTPQGWKWLTVPVKLEGDYRNYLIKDVEIDNSQNWRKDHLGTLNNVYRKAPYFQEVFPLFDDVLGKEQRLVIELNYELVFSMCDYLRIPRSRFMFSQEMDIPEEARQTDRLLAILDKVGQVSTYVSGPAAQAYMELDKFEERGIGVEWHHYDHPYYNQNTWGSNVFIPYLSVVDLLFNHGRESLDILLGKKRVDKPTDVQVVMPDEYKKSAG